MKLAAMLTRPLTVAAMVLSLTACGGGGGGGGDEAVLDGTTSPIPSGVVAGPPATALSAATLLGNMAAQPLLEVQGAVIASITRGERIARQVNGLQALLSALGGSAGAVPSSTRERPLATLNLACTQFLDPGCTGAVTLTTNITALKDNALPQGGFLAAQFAQLQGSTDGDVVNLNGGVLFEFLTNVNLEATSLAGARMRVTAADASGAFNGVPFGPLSEAALLAVDRVDQADVLTVTVDGARYTNLDNDAVEVSGAADFNISGVTLRNGYYRTAAEASAVDYAYDSWVVTDRQPATGSTMRIVAGTAALHIEATSNIDNQTTFVLTVRDNNVAGDRYQITVTFEPDGTIPGQAVKLP